MSFNFNELNIIAEIGVNHEGDIATAKKMLQLAAETGVQYVKFQSYTPERYASANDSARLERVTSFALTKENFEELATLATDLGVEFLCTPLSEDWVDILELICPAYKIASGDITFKKVIQKSVQTGKPVIVSTGGATIEEIDQAVAWVKDVIGSDDLKDRLILMHCVSAYPTPIEEANVLTVPFLKERYGINVGYSNHVTGMNACLAAVALGANPVEVHFTDNKHDREFRDHALSFDQNDLKSFVKTANEIKKSLGTYGKTVQPCEKESVPMMRKGVIAARELKKGETIADKDLLFARPAVEFPANESENIIGKTLLQDVSKGHLIPKDAI